MGGQVLDILSESKKIDFETLQTIHKYKTGSLFECAMLSGALCANADDDKIKAIEEFAQNFDLFSRFMTIFWMKFQLLTI